MGKGKQLCAFGKYFTLKQIDRWRHVRKNKVVKGPRDIQSGQLSVGPINFDQISAIFLCFYAFIHGFLGLLILNLK